MNDLKTLYEAWDAPAAPSHRAAGRARLALLARARRRRLRLGVRLAALGAAALALLTAVTVTENLGGTGADVPVASAAPVLERAAAAAAEKPFVAPRDDQWIYVKERFGGSVSEPVARQQTWRRADGGGFAFVDEHGKLHVEIVPRPQPHSGRPGPELFESYKALAALPTDPAALLRWAYARAANTTGGGKDDDGDVYLILNHILRSNVLPPDLEAGIFRAMKQIPGVTVEEVEVSGRPVFALGLHTSDSLYEELLLDPATHAYVGERSTVTRNATIDPLKAGDTTGEVRKGRQVVVERVTTAIVDEPGERR
jgi:hypothetical protein